MLPISVSYSSIVNKLNLSNLYLSNYKNPTLPYYYLSLSHFLSKSNVSLPFNKAPISL